MKRPRKILVIDNQVSFRTAVRSFLEDAGYLVYEANDGQAGMGLFLREQPDLVLTDLRMPLIDGLALLAAVRERAPGIPVIVMTGTMDRALASTAIDSGSWGCLCRPVADMNYVVTAVDLALAHHPEASGATAEPVPPCQKKSSPPNPLSASLAALSQDDGCNPQGAID